ncbi:MAG: hypothetical protein MUF81_10905, partial [Verrucomicrobia bacterium]|nr:hypothetical protein [Verrucomicrobiota bacterium]
QSEKSTFKLTSQTTGNSILRLNPERDIHAEPVHFGRIGFLSMNHDLHKLSQIAEEHGLLATTASESVSIREIRV